MGCNPTLQSSMEYSPNMSDWITTDEAARIALLHEEYIRALLRTGRIKGQKWGRSWQVSRKSLLTYLNRMSALGHKRGRHKSQP